MFMEFESSFHQFQHQYFVCGVSYIPKLSTEITAINFTEPHLEVLKIQADQSRDPRHWVNGIRQGLKVFF